MVKSLYRILGVRKNASSTAIKVAHRALVQKHHPDVGGRPERFMEIDRAYKVLRDKDRRARYDDTGEIDEKSVLQEMDQVRELLAKMFGELLGAGVAFDKKVSIVDLLRRVIEGNREKFTTQRAGFAAKITQMKELRATISREGEGRNLFADITDNFIRKLEENSAKLKDSLDIGARALEELTLYKSFARTVQVVQMQRVMVFGGGASVYGSAGPSTTSTTG